MVVGSALLWGAMSARVFSDLTVTVRPCPFQSEDGNGFSSPSS